MTGGELMWGSIGLLFFVLLAAAGGAAKEDENDTSDIGW